MAEKKVKGVLKNNNKERNETLNLNKGEYKAYDSKIITGLKDAYRIEDNAKNPVMTEQHDTILGYTHYGENEYSQKLREDYGFNEWDKHKKYVFYSVKNTPTKRIEDFDEYKDYMSYIWDVYGKEESYVGHLTEMLGVRDAAEDLAYNLAPLTEGTAQDVINDILKYTDVKYAMEGDRVGIVRNINVIAAANGVITTNINNYSGKETKLGYIGNKMYAQTLMNAAQFNSLRRSKYITPNLERVYGNNLSNVYNLGSLFTNVFETGRIGDPDSNEYAGLNMPNGNVFDYLSSINPDFELPNKAVNGEQYDWSQHITYGINEMQYDKQRMEDTHTATMWKNGRGDDVSMSVYSEGDDKVEDASGDYSSYKFRESDTIGIGSINNIGIVDDIQVMTPQSIISKTNKFLRERKINTLISRFHDKDNNEKSSVQTATSPTFGVSHGRNLLTKKAFETNTADTTNGYSNPYCRVWTAHHQYSKMKHLIRPFTNEGNFTPISDLQKEWFMFRGENGGARLSDRSVLNKNGMVNITPTNDGKVDVKRCMFSIENLAWQDVLKDQKGSYRFTNGDTEPHKDNENVLSPEQIGPNGGRIMWFPPYDLNFQETTHAQWSTNDFIGRGEPVYTYTNSKRSGTLDFTMLVDHPAVVNYWMLNKRANATEEDEQTLLRFFAGCETIDPMEDILEHLDDNGIFTGSTKDPQLVDKEKDVIFYTFFPNDYSGVDYYKDIKKGETKEQTEGEIEPFKYLFGGHMDKSNISIKAELKTDEYINTKLKIPTDFYLLDKSVTVTVKHGDDPPTTKTLEVNYELIDAPENTWEKLKLSEITISEFNEAEYECERHQFEYEIKNGNICFTIPLETTQVHYYNSYELYIDGYNAVYAQFSLVVAKGRLDGLSEKFKILKPQPQLDAPNATEERSEKTLFLGYEMGVNPISLTNVEYKAILREESDVFLDKVYGYGEAERVLGEDIKKYKDSIKITIKDVCDVEYKIDNEKIAYTHSKYNDIKEGKETALENIETENGYESRLSELSNETELNEKKIEELKKERDELIKIKTELENTEGFNFRTDTYLSLKLEIAAKDDEIAELEKENKKKEKQTKKTEKEKANDEKIAKDYDELIQLTETLYKKRENKGEFISSNPLYVYFNYTSEKTYTEGEGVEVFDDPIEAYVKYKMETKTYITYEVKDENEIPYKLLGTNEKYCRTVYEKDGNKQYKYWKRELDTNKASENIPFFEFGGKKEFMESGYPFGKYGTLRFVNNNGTFKSYPTESVAVQAILKNGLIPQMTIEEYNALEDGSGIFIFQDPTTYYFYYFEVVEWKDMNSETEKQELYKEYENQADELYKNHKYGSLSEMGTEKNYGIIQLFFKGKFQEDGSLYENIQDFIARHDVKKYNDIKTESGATPTDKLQYHSTGESKYITNDGNLGASIESNIEWNINKDNRDTTYLVDNSKKNTIYKKQTSYHDTDSYGLNSTMEYVRQNVNPDVTFSFGEVYAALQKDDEKYKNYVLQCERGILEQRMGYKDEELEKLVQEADDRIEYLKGVFYPSEEETNFKITEILTKGTASGQGTADKNKELSKNRKESIEKFLKTFAVMKNVKTGDDESPMLQGEQGNASKEDTVGDSNTKIMKSARYTRTIIVVGDKDKTATEKLIEEIPTEEDIEKRRRKLARRYDNERYFFEMLQENNKLAYNKLIDKVKYFSPAFHSTTPEGFNARLTFLHQCTRQGPTATASDLNKGSTAANLAFGRAPFCILRLGDFLNTKIVIESINITYPDSQWDFNPEGIGAQFMMAKVSMQIHILGGSDISGPIKRLQNAVSFNYYANTSVYDNRSDIAESYTEGKDFYHVQSREWFPSLKEKRK